MQSGQRCRRGSVNLARAGPAATPVVSGERKGTMMVQGGAWLSRQYCSPEQADAAYQVNRVPEEQRARLTRRTDVWSWAVSVLVIFSESL